MPITVDGNEVYLPKTFGATLMKDAFEQSTVGRLTGSEPISIGEKVIPLYEGGIEAGAVAEAAPKPVSNPTISHKVLTPVKVATIVLVSKEAARLNPGQMLGVVQADLRNSIGRAVDMLAFYGKDGRGVDVAAQAGNFVNATTNRSELVLTGAGAKSVGETFLDAYALAGENGDPDAFAFDSRWRAQVVLATDKDGNRLREGALDLSAQVDSVMGLRAVYGRTVAGRTSMATETAVKGFLGDWSKVRWGFAENIEIQRSTEATIVDGANTYHLFQQNMTALLVEATVGVTVLDPQAFSAIEDTTVEV